MVTLEVTFFSPGQAENLLPSIQNLDLRGILPSTSTEEALPLREDSGNIVEALLTTLLTLPLLLSTWWRNVEKSWDVRMESHLSMLAQTQPFRNSFNVHCFCL